MSSLSARRLAPAVRFAVLAATLGACSPRVIRYTDQYTGMQEACRWDEYREKYADQGAFLEVPSNSDGREVPAYPSDACIDRVLADLHVEVAEFLEVDGLDDPYDASRGFGPVGCETLLSGPLAGVRGLVLKEYDDVETFRGSPLVADAWLDELSFTVADTGVDGLHAAQYNFVTSAIADVVVGDTENDHAAFFGTESRTLFVNRTWCGGDLEWQWILTHEAGHAFPDRHHVDCDSEEDSDLRCDDSYDGAVAFGASSLFATAPFYELENVRWAYAVESMRQLGMVNTFNTDGELDPDVRAEFDAVFADVYDYP